MVHEIFSCQNQLLTEIHSKIHSTPIGLPASMGSPLEVVSQGLPAPPGQGELGCREQSTGVGRQTILKYDYRYFRVKD